MKIRIRSRIETLTEKLAQRTRITCASMPQALTEQQLHVLRFVVVKGRTPGGVLALAALLGITRQAFSQFTAPLFLMGLIERVPVDGAAGGSANGNISQGSIVDVAPIAYGPDTCDPVTLGRLFTSLKSAAGHVFRAAVGQASPRALAVFTQAYNGLLQCGLADYQIDAVVPGASMRFRWEPDPRATRYENIALDVLRHKLEAR